MSALRASSEFWPAGTIALSSEDPHYWFPAKRYGWGWGVPITWQGWVVLVVWLVLVAVPGPYLVRRSLLLFNVFIGAMIVILLAILYAKGEPPRWRWGEDR